MPHELIFEMIVRTYETVQLNQSTVYLIGRAPSRAGAGRNRKRAAEGQHNDPVKRETALHSFQVRCRRFGFTLSRRGTRRTVVSVTEMIECHHPQSRLSLILVGKRNENHRNNLFSKKTKFRSQ